MRSSIKKYLCGPIDNPERLDGTMNTEDIYIYELDEYFYYALSSYSKGLRKRKLNFYGLLYDFLSFEEGAVCMGYWFRKVPWSDKYTPMEAYVKYLAPYK